MLLVRGFPILTEAARYNNPLIVERNLYTRYWVRGAHCWQMVDIGSGRAAGRIDRCRIDGCEVSSGAETLGNCRSSENSACSLLKDAARR